MNNKKDNNRLKFILIVASIFFGTWLVGFIVNLAFANIASSIRGEAFRIDWKLLVAPGTWIIGLICLIVAGIFGFLYHLDDMKASDRVFGRRKRADVDSVLENSRFMTEKERDFNFTPFTYENISEVKNDGVPVRAVIDKKGQLRGNFMSGAHSLVIGATGSGKTTTFVNPMIQLIGASKKGSSMIVSDPKGELFDMHSQYLKDLGYDVRVLDLRDTYSSDRWNPLDSIWDMYQEYASIGKGMKAHRDDVKKYPELKIIGDSKYEAEQVWIEYEGKAYLDVKQCQEEILVAKQKIYDEMYEDLNDFVSVLCPITNEKDPLWEKGARSIVLATCLAMLEDSENPELGMTKEKYNFFNVNKMLTNSENEFAALKEYFKGRNPMSQAVTLSKQVLSSAPQTMSSYMSITFDKLNLFNDRGICGLTSATDIDASSFASKPTALFMKIPDEKDTRHGLASLFILCIYKALIKVASSREDLSLPRNVYFILDEFGNLPKIEKFDKMITVGRSRKIWFNMVIQSYAQLNATYGDQIANIVKSNCAMKMFIGSNDIETCKEFSELCGNKTVKTTSTSGSTAAKVGDLSISTQTQVRPLIYPSELQKLNNRESTGNAIIVTFGNYPLQTTYTPSYKCDYYKFGKMDMSGIRSHMFRSDEAFYDIEKRNRKIGEKE